MAYRRIATAPNDNPHPRRQDGQRVEQEDHPQRRGQEVYEQPTTVGPQTDHDHRDHHQRAYRGDGETRERRVAPGHQETGDRAHAGCGEVQDRTRGQGPQPASEQITDEPQETDVQAGDRDQMTGAGAVEDVPLHRVYRLLVPYRQGRDDPRFRPVP